MRPVLLLAVAGLLALILAALTGSTPLAVVVIALAVAGIVQLVRDWRREPAAESDPANQTSGSAMPQQPENPRIFADEFTPDISTDPDGPSSNARADQG